MNGYETGYGKPPAHARFLKGRSGNPRGRPKGSRNLATILQRALDEPVVVTHNGKRRSISKLEAAVTQMVNKAATGDARNLAQLLLQAQTLEARRDAVVTETLGVDDARVVASLRQRLGSGGQGPDDP